MDHTDASHIQDQQNEDIFSTTTQFLLIGLALVSSFISLLFPVLYYIKRKCRQHPSPLISVISLLEALSNYNVILIAVNIYQFQHLTHINQVFQFLFFYSTQQPTQSQFCEINFTIYIILQLMSIAYNICFSADLLITLKKPFFSGKKRMKFYNIFCLILVLCSLPMSIIQSKQICAEEFHTRSIYKVPLAFLSTLILFYIVSFIIIIMSFRTVQSNQIRKKYIRLHRIILLTLIILWVFPIATNILIYIGDESSQLFHIFNIGSFFSLLLSGAIINIVRFYNDPYVFQQIVKMIKCKIKEKKKKNDDEQENQEQDGDIWNLPLAHAVATFHHQSVVSNIIQIVLQTCTNTPEQLAIQKSQYEKGSHIYNTEGTILNLREVKKMLKIGRKQDVKRLSKITKHEEMLCLQKRQKNIYKTNDIVSSFANSNQFNVSSILSQENKQKKKVANMNKFIKNEKAITIKVRSYADPVFVALRIYDNFTSDELKKTLDLSLNSQNIKKARQSLGASGSFFFFSYDHRMVIKTISESQCKLFLKILPDYYEHILQNPSSLLSRTYGLFSVQIAGISKIYFVMMQNTLKDFEDNNIVFKKYDLKGSTIKRQVKNPNSDVFKDINFLKSDDAFLIMSAQRKQKLLKQIQADITLLSRQNIMDYSLLLGVGFYKKVKKSHQPIHTEDDLYEKDNQWRFFDDGHQITGKLYTISIIDYLQEFNMNKYMQLKLKKVFKGGGDISSVDTKTYYERFLKFVNMIIVSYRS